MKRFLIIAVALIASVFLFAYTARADGTINQLSQWKSDGSYITQNVPNKSIKITGLESKNCLGTDADGVLQAGTCTGEGGGSGTVTSVALTVPTGLSISGSPITTSGTFALSLTSGYVIPKSASTTDWNTAYLNRITSASSPLSLSSNVLSIQAASGSQNGYLSSTDWTTFNGKQGAITLTTTGTSGAATFSAGTLNIPQYAGNTYSASYPITLTSTTFGLAFSTTTNNTWSGTNTFASNKLTVSGLSDGCVEISSGLLTSTGDNCGTGSGGITSLNGLTGSSQTFATSTSGGLDLHISSSGSAHTFTLAPASGYLVPLSASTTNWNTFYNTPSNRITAGTGLSWSGNTLNASAASIAWGAITGTLSSQTDLQTALNGKIAVGTTSIGSITALPSLSLPYSQLTSKPTIPTKTSDLTNDSGFITSYTETDPIFVASAAHSITSTDITHLSNLSGTNTGDQDLSGYALTSSLAAVATSGAYSDLTGTPTIPAFFAYPFLSNATSTKLTFSGGLSTTYASTTAVSGTSLCIGSDCRTTWPSSGGTPTWGTIAGTLSDQTDLQSALNAKLSLSSWYATTTDGLAQGSVNKYWSNTLFDNRLSATTSLPALATASNLGTVKTSLSGVLKASSGVLSAATNGTDYTLITAKTCTSGDFVSSLTAAGVFTCTTPSASGVAWGSITGTLSSQTDLQTALDAKLSLSSWFATTTAPQLTTLANLGTVKTSLSGILKASSGVLSAASAGTDYEVPLTFSTGLTRSTNTITVNTTQNISRLSNLTSNGFVKAGSSNGTLSIDTSTYLTGNQSITLSGAVSGSGATSITTAYAGTLGVALGGTGTTTLGGILAGNGSSGIKSAVIGSGLSFDGTTLSASGGSSYTATYPITLTGSAFGLVFGTTTANTWSSLQTITYASTTALAASGELTHPYGSAPSLFANGDIVIDSTASQLKYQAGGATRVLMPEQSRSFTYATSTWTGTTTIPLDAVINPYTFTRISCFTDAGTVDVDFYDGTSRTNLVVASTTNGITTLTSNNDMTAGKKVNAEIGTPASSPTKIVCTAAYTFDAQ